MVDTSVRVSEDTYKMVVKTRGIFEQLFRQKLSLDDTLYLATRIVSFIYETVQKLDAQNRIKIVEVGEGAVNIEGLENVSDVLPDVIDEITEIKEKLAEKQKETSRQVVTTTR